MHDPNTARRKDALDLTALAGEGGTLAEIGFAMKMNRPMVALKSWPELPRLHRAETAADAVALALRLAGRRRR